jgi:hypothetical protein
VLGEDGDDHGGIFGALALVDGGGIQHAGESGMIGLNDVALTLWRAS